MRIRRLSPDDWPAYRSIRLRALEADPDAFGETLAGALGRSDLDWRERLERPDRITLLAEDAGDLLGTASGGPAPEHEGAAGLYGMWVAPEARGRGIGMALIDAVKAWARERGYTDIGLGVTTTNAPAVQLYERAGFVDTGDRYALRDDTDLEIQIMATALDPRAT